MERGSRRGRARTDDLFRVREALSQLSYAPSFALLERPERAPTRLPGFMRRKTAKTLIIAGFARIRQRDAPIAKGLSEVFARSTAQTK